MSESHLSPPESRRSLFFLISGSSGVGKSTIINELLHRDPHLKKPISATTRCPRGEEIDGIDYYFLDTQTFSHLIQDREVLEYAVNYDNFYGLLKSEVNKLYEEKVDIIKDLSYEALSSIKRVGLPKFKLVSIFIRPPSFADLEKRIRLRGDTSVKETQLRSKQYEKEIESAQSFDYVIVNNDLQQAIEELSGIILLQRRIMGVNFGL